ncbi:hypothetical protein BDF14DRAFT_970185 [Spinellus fusiger]|nr:hypothetical protein BDF14DRAFT_970185 [Spinellus fusiger]
MHFYHVHFYHVHFGLGAITVSEPYMEFKESVISTYLVKLLASENENVKLYALKAWSHFSANDISTLLPEKAKEYISNITDTYPNQGHVDVLAKLMSYELDSMRRGLFKEEIAKRSTPEGPAVEAASSLSSPADQYALLHVGNKEHTLGGLFVSGWENARILPGLRSGYTIATLYALNDLIRSDAGANNATAIVKTKWYRCMQTAIADVGLTDHLMVRVSSLGAWIAFFEVFLVGNEADIESKGVFLLKDLITRLEKSTVPGTTCNILLAMTGLIVTAYRVIPSFAVVSAIQFIDVLTSKYISKAGHSTSYSPLLTSEEVQFAARFSLGYVAACTITNEKTLKGFTEIMLENIIMEKSSRNIDTAVDLIQFANGFSAGHFTATLAVWPTKTAAIKDLVDGSLSTLLDYCSKAPECISESKALGMMMGWASNIKQDDMTQVYQFAKEMVCRYVQGTHVNKGVLLGSLWVCAYAVDMGEGQLEEKYVNLLESAVAFATSDPLMNLHLFHFQMASAKIARMQMVFSEQDNEGTEAYQEVLLKQVQLVQKDEPSSHERTTALLSLGALLGVDYLNTQPSSERLCHEAHHYSAKTRSPVLDALAIAAGLMDGGAPVGHLKNGRIGAVVCGKTIHTALAMREALQIEANEMSVEYPEFQRQRQTRIAMASSSEPTSYARLNNNTSYLRSVFDALVAMTETAQGPLDASLQDISLLLLSSLRHTPGPLPPVNWYNLLTKLTTISSLVWKECILLATTHATTSMSLTEYIIAQVGRAASPLPDNLQVLLLGEAGLEKILELSGLQGKRQTKAQPRRRGMDAVTKKMSVSSLRCIELVETLVKALCELPVSLQKVFLTSLENYLPSPNTPLDEDKASFVESLRSMVLYNVTLPLIERVDVHPQEEKEAPTEQQKVLCMAVECSVLEIDQLLQKVELKEWLTPSTAYKKTVAVMKLCSLNRTDRAIKWITEMSTQLLILGVGEAKIWQVIAEAIQVNAQKPQERITWIVRLLDVLIVIGSLRLPNCLICLQIGIGKGLRCVLSTVWQTQCSVEMTKEDCDVEVALADASYLLTHVIDEAKEYSQQQQQMIKRIFKLIELVDAVEERILVKGFFVQVLRQCSEETVGKEPQMAKLIPFEP